jgi:hypothetical protein
MAVNPNEELQFQDITFTRQSSTTSRVRSLFGSVSRYQRLDDENNVSRNNSRRSRETLESAAGRRFSLISELNFVPEQDGMDLGLMSTITDHHGDYDTKYPSPNDFSDEDEPITMDISSFGGPLMSSNEDDAAVKYRLESQGQLTGGLGAGFAPAEEIRVKKEDLTITSDLTSMPSLRRNNLARTRTVKEFGQRLANKKGEIIRVVIEDEPADFDLNGYSGRHPGEGIYHAATSMSASTLNLPLTIETFYPEANWKPISMRWPFITFMTLISILLAIVQEYVYRLSAHHQRQDPPTGLYTYIKPEDLKDWDYFSFKYLPTLVAVTYAVLWQITDVEVQRLEAFHQLSKTKGALAAESINVDYITYASFLRPFRALKYKHFAVMESSTISFLAASLVPTLQSASLVLAPDRSDRLAHPLSPKYVLINGLWSRLLTATLLLIAVLGTLLLWQLQHRQSGLVTDPKGIAGIAAMANRSHILMDFKDLDTALPDDIHAKLKKHRYVLRASSIAPADDIKLSYQEIHKYDGHQIPSNPHPLSLRLIAGVPFMIFMLLFIAFIPIVLFTSASILTDHASWILTLLAVTIKLTWGSIESDLKMMEPFYILSKRYAPPKTLTLDYTSLAFGLMPIQALLNGHILMFLVGLGSVLAEILTVCVTSFSGVAGTDFLQDTSTSTRNSSSAGISEVDQGGDSRNAGEETFTSFWVSFALSMAILVFLCFTASLVYLRRRHPFLPRQPNTIASVIAYIHQSVMLYDFVDSEKLSNSGMVSMLESLKYERPDGRGTVGEKKTYGLGWFKGRDGQIHCGIDEEKLRGSYVFGKDPNRAIVHGSSNWQNF